MKCLGLIQCAEEPQGLSWNHFFLAHLRGGNCAPVPKHRAGFTYRLYRLKSGVSRSKGSSRKLWYAHGRRKDFFHGGWKVVIFYFSRSKLRKQPLLLRISKSMMGTEPPPAPLTTPMGMHRFICRYMIKSTNSRQNFMSWLFMKFGFIHLIRFRVDNASLSTS